MQTSASFSASIMFKLHSLRSVKYAQACCYLAARKTSTSGLSSVCRSISTSSTDVESEKRLTIPAKAKKALKQENPVDLYTGYGRRRSTNGDEYEGEWENGLHHGFGKKMIKANAPSRIGKVKELLTSGDFEYDGEWSNGKRSGYGKVTYKNGAELQGVFENGQLVDGIGVVMKSRGKVYEGEVINRREHGQGKMTYIGGQVLQGEFRNGRIFNGHGALPLKDGTIYEGTWQEGRRCGPGKTLYSDGVVLEAEFRAGKVWAGRGTLRSQQQGSGAWVGTWTDGQLNGPGSILRPDGRNLTGIFVGGKIFTGQGVSIEEGEGNQKGEKGTVYEGVWTEGVFCGVATQADGSTRVH